MSTTNANDTRDLLLAAFNDLTTGEAIMPEQTDAIARAVSDALDGVRDLERALATVTAQRDQCREWIAGVDEYRRTCFEVGDTTAAHVIASMWVSLDGRAALRACDEKRSGPSSEAAQASIAAEGGAK